MTMDKTTFPFPKGEVFRVEGSKVNAEMSERPTAATSSMRMASLQRSRCRSTPRRTTSRLARMICCRST